MNSAHRRAGLRGEEGGIARKRLIQQIDFFALILRANRAEAEIENEVLGPAVKFECRDVCGRAFLDGILLAGESLACNWSAMALAISLWMAKT